MGREYYGMEWIMDWKGKIGMAYGMAQVWNGIEKLMYGIEQIFHIPYKFHTYTFWHGVAEARFAFSWKY